MKEFLKYPKLKLLYGKHLKVINETFDTLDSWIPSGDWHRMTIDTNTDMSSGLDGNLALNCAGAYNDSGAILERIITLKNYSEITFEYYVQNDDVSNGLNRINFYIDNSLKYTFIGPSPWQRCLPIGLTPGPHKLRFEYLYDGLPNKKKGVIDNVIIYEGKKVNCLITEYSPPSPIRNISSIKTLRGYTRYQEMTASDTEIKFTALFDSLNFNEFMEKSNDIFYFVDEHGIMYRGVFPSSVSAKNITLNQYYSIDLIMISNQKTGVGIL